MNEGKSFYTHNLSLKNLMFYQHLNLLLIADYLISKLQVVSNTFTEGLKQSIAQKLNFRPDKGNHALTIKNNHDMSLSIIK